MYWSSYMSTGNYGEGLNQMVKDDLKTPIWLGGVAMEHFLGLV